jgi:hypothetical protein
VKRPGLIRSILLAFGECLIVVLIFGTAWGVLLIGHGLGYN